MFRQTEINTLGFKAIHFHSMTTNVLVTDNKKSVPVALLFVDRNINITQQLI